MLGPPRSLVPSEVPAYEQQQPLVAVMPRVRRKLNAFVHRSLFPSCKFQAMQARSSAKPGEMW